MQQVLNSGNTVNNNYNIINNITQIKCGEDDTAFDIEVVTSLVKLGYNIDEVNAQLQVDGSHIKLLYAKMLADKQARAYSFLSSLSPHSGGAALSNNWVL